MPQLKLKHVTDAETLDSRWGWLCKIGGVAALLIVVILPIQIIAYIVSPPSSTAIDYFTLFQSNSGVCYTMDRHIQSKAIGQRNSGDEMRCHN